jgi:cell division initiation protein
MRENQQAAGGPTPGRLTPLDVQQKEFRVSFRGYNEREVDEFLDKVTEEIQRYEAELMRVRTERATFDPSTLDIDAESQRILREARERADAIVREAEARAAGIPTASATDTRAMVAPYLNREREFLQQLGTLVQGHAQTIKTMVEEARRRTERAAAHPEPAATPFEAPIAVPPPVPSPADDAATAGEPLFARRADETSDESPVEAESSVEAGEPPGEAQAAPDPKDGDVVVVGNERERPVPAPIERGDERSPEGARSLRELFWGED